MDKTAMVELTYLELEVLIDTFTRTVDLSNKYLDTMDVDECICTNPDCPARIAQISKEGIERGKILVEGLVKKFSEAEQKIIGEYV